MTARLHPFASLLACLLALTLGCAKMADTSSASPGYGSGGDYGGEGYTDEDGVAYGYEMDMVETASRGRSAPAKKEMFGGDKVAEYEESKNDEAPMTLPGSTPVVTRDSAGIELAPDEPTPTEPVRDERQIIYRASLQLAVYELDEVMAFAEDIPRRHGGWIQARYDYQITLRVPADHLQAVIAELAELGLVLGKTLQADDVTAQYTDLASRIAVLEQLVEQLELLLQAAKTVEDSLKVRQELERVRIELEAAKVQMRQLAESISFSTLTLALSLRGPVESLPSSNDPFPWVDELGVESTEFR